MRKYRRVLLHGLLVVAFTYMPVVMFGYNSGVEGRDKDVARERSKIDRTQNRFRFGVSYGRPYWYRPHYYYYPYRPYYYRYDYRPYKPYHRW